MRFGVSANTTKCYVSANARSATTTPPFFSPIRYSVPSQHGGFLNSRRATSPLVCLMEEEERCEAPDHPQGVLPQNWRETELNRSVTCMGFKATTNDRRYLALCHDEFRGK
ncbi:uncharacterized protein TNCV_226361 [Trichonephila clavipes]|nr:uncharacterized protein TNCV_226361 [Trichonephila clavipes]